MEEHKTFHNEYKDSPLLRDNENILGSDNDYLLNNKLDESKNVLCTGDDINEAQHPYVDKIQVALDVAGVLGPWGAIPDAINGIIYLCRGDLDSMKFSLMAIFTPVPASVAKGAANATKYANKITTKGYVFWSGGNKARKAAEDFAKENGFTTLEMTQKGSKIDRNVNNKYLKHIYKQGYNEAINIVKKKGLKNQDDINAYIRSHMDDIRDLATEAKNGVSNQLYMLLDNKKIADWGANQFAKASEEFARKAGKSGKEIHNFRTRKYNGKSVWMQKEREIVYKEYNRSSKVHLVK